MRFEFDSLLTRSICIGHEASVARTDNSKKEQSFTIITEDMYMRRRVVVRVHHDSIAGESQDGRHRMRIAYS